MVIHLSFVDSPRDIQDVSECMEIFLGGNASQLNITVDLLEVESNWVMFERTVFIADLLGINGVFLLSNKSEKIPEKINALFDKSSFKYFNKLLYSKENRDDYAYPKRPKENVNNQMKPASNMLRTITIWNDAAKLIKGKELRLHFLNEIVEAAVLQVQKVISPDYNGSIFGLNSLKSKEIGTILYKSDSNININYYKEKPEDGFFVIKSTDDRQELGYGITIS